MPKPAKQRQADYAKRKSALGQVKRYLWVYPETWDEIKAFADSKAGRRELIDTTPNNSELEHVDQPVDVERCDKTLEMFDED